MQANVVDVVVADVIDVVLHSVVAAQSYVLAARCARVSRHWRSTVDRIAFLLLDTGVSLQSMYDTEAEAFVAALPAFMNSTYQQMLDNLLAPNLLAVFFTTDNVAYDGPADVDYAMRAAVRHVRQGLKAHLHNKGAVLACLTEAVNIQLALRQIRSHPGILARPCTWTLLRVLRAHPGDGRLGVLALGIIDDFQTVMSEGNDMVVLSAERRPRAISVIDAFIQTFADGCPSGERVREVGQQVIEWIQEGAILSAGSDSD